MKNKLIILYTSDVHGQLLSTNYVTNEKMEQGLIRFSSYINNLDSEILCLENGDFLQGSPLLDFGKILNSEMNEPLIDAMNSIGYQYLTLGNHDFNYGQKYLNQTLKALNAQVICANILDDNHKHVYSPYKIHQTKKGLKVGIIGVVTHYIPNWEKKRNILGYHFMDAYETLAQIVPIVRSQCDFLVVLYHGGFEKNMTNGNEIGRQTGENQGYHISQIKGIDLLLTGHQHVPQIYQDSKMIILQTGLSARDFGKIEIEYKEHEHQIEIINKNAELVKMNMKEDHTFFKMLGKWEKGTQKWLDQNVGTTSISMEITNPLNARNHNHPMFQLINHLQMKLSNAMISCASLPNECPGFLQTITRREIAANFIYPNTLVKLEINGKQLKDALEKSAEYFSKKDDRLVVSDTFLYPKVEHYNFDVYAGIDYELDIKQKIGSRVTKLLYKHQNVKESDIFTLVLNNYRSVGGGDYSMFKDAHVLEEYDIALADLVLEYIIEVKDINFVSVQNFKIKL